MAGSFGGTIKLTGESDYRKALKSITSDLKLMSTELKLTTVQFSTGDKSVKETKTSYDNMNKTVQDQRIKVNELREALNKAEQEYGSNNEKVKTFKSQLNNAETQLIQMENATGKSTKELKEMKKGFDDASDGALSFGDVLKANILGDAIIGGIKGLGSVVKSLGSAFINTAKEALGSYSDYEQLIGGVSTLLGTNEMTIEEYAKSVNKSVDDVREKYAELEKSQKMTLDNANKAYKTAGLSANEYMETVTSFSASLLQSLDGDTVKASEKANQAIIDMADNANKMGTDIASIQNAYQGFAKQNYTMLDNLKLGYGGTKTEMERLLSDATKISGTKYDLSNLSDVYDAIHVIQNEMKITGTTSKEATKTIQGSLSSMKSSWTNLITGIANEDADLKGLISEFVESVVTVGDNIMPKVDVIINGIVELVMSLAERLVEYMPQLLETGMSLLQTIMDGFTAMLPQLIPLAVQLITNLSSFILGNLPTILQAGITLLMELIKGIASALPELMPVAVQCIMDLVNTLLDNIDELIECGIQLLVALTDGIFNALPELISRLPEIIVKVVAKLIELTPQLLSCTLRLMVSIATGMVKYTVEIVTRIPKIIKSIVNAFIQHLKDMTSVGKNLVSGIWNGISGSIDWLKKKIKGWVGDVTKFIKKLFGINSPSKLFKDEIGTNMALGIGEGFSDTMKNISQDMADSIPTEFDTNINTNYSSNSSSQNSNYDGYVRAFKEALSGMAFKVNDEKFGELVIDKVEKVVYA